ncbi:hypothetical protein ACF09Y_22320 [Streptomyces massasporeus]|uniref:hypothetical protein n=1 Tax=Streptomyces massasporeus TaxID=67324 RepID=UPI0036F8A70F
MPSSTQTTQSAAWPEGVIARYLTDAGKALADPTVAVDIHGNSSGGSALRVTCRVCPWEYTAFGPFGTCFTDEYVAKAAADDAHQRAQAHAEKCRALPRPTA